MKWVFWVSAGLITYVYAGYPFWVYLRSQLRPRLWRQEDIFPTVSVLLVVHNEAERIEEKLRNLLELDYPTDRLEILVVSDGSQDMTNAILAGYGGERLRVFQCPVQHGKAAGLDLGIKQALGEIVVFTDVRQRLEKASVRFLVSNFADPTVGCVAGDLVLREEGQTGTQAGIGFYWRYEKWIRKCEARIDSAVGVSGGLYAVRQKLLTTLPKGTILDDLYIPLDVVRQGYRSVFDSRARARDALPQSHRREFQRKVRTLTGNYQLLQLAPWLLRAENRVRFQFISHKLLRLLVPVFLITLFLSSLGLAADPFFLGLTLLQAGFYVCAALGLWLRPKRLQRLLGGPAAFCLLNGAAVMGLVYFAFSRDPLWCLWDSARANKGSGKEEA